MRAPAGGRVWEGCVFFYIEVQLRLIAISYHSFGGDPFLTGEGAYETIMGIQSNGVPARAKHYINK